MMESYLSPEHVTSFKENGFLVINDFISPDEADQLKADCHQHVEQFDLNEHRIIFDTTNMTDRSTEYFLASHDKICYFFEKDAIDAKGDLVVPRNESINKIGHALHTFWPNYRRVTFNNKVKGILRDLQFVDPGIIQSMYIFKNPKIGAVVTPHQDATYLMTNPTHHLLGFWIALDNAEIENGCLWAAPGSHKSGLINNRRMIRTMTPKNEVEMVTTCDPPELDDSTYVPLLAPKGTLVLIDGYVVHKSAENKSTKSREIYTWHVIGREDGVEWNTDNWINLKGGIADFEPVYTTNP